MRPMDILGGPIAVCQKSASSAACGPENLNGRLTDGKPAEYRA